MNENQASAEVCGLPVRQEGELNWQDKIARKRKRQILRIVATRNALVGFVLIMSPFVVACFVGTVPGDHGDGGDSLSWMVAGCLIMITPIGLICVGFAGILLIIRALLR